MWYYNDRQSISLVIDMFKKSPYSQLTFSASSIKNVKGNFVPGFISGNTYFFLTWEGAQFGAQQAENYTKLEIQCRSKWLFYNKTSNEFVTHKI